jgi:HSP20 family protein
MSLTRWDDAFTEMSILQREMNPIFDDVAQDWTGDANTASGWLPETDIYETEASLVLQADLPGFKANDIDIVVENNVLTIRGERQLDPKVERENFHRMERSFGKFSRSFTLPTGVEAQKIQANYKNGVLSLTLEKAEHARPKRIQIAATAAS